MKFEMRELANMKDEVTEGVSDKVPNNLDKHMKAFVTATEEIRARVRSAEREANNAKGLEAEREALPPQDEMTEKQKERKP